MAQLARVLKTRLGNDILSDSDILLWHVNLPIENCSTSASKQTNTVSDASGSNFILNIRNGNSLHDTFGDKSVSFLSNLSIGDNRPDPFEWWKAKKSRCPNVAGTERNIRSIQTSSVASDQYFSSEGHVVDRAS